MTKYFATFLATLCIISSLAFARAPQLKSRYDIIDLTFKSLVRVEVPLEDEQSKVCAGFVIDASKGRVLTAAHCVVEDNTFVDGEPTTIIATNGSLTVISMTPMTKPPLTIRKDNPRFGEEVISIGLGYGNLMVLPRSVAGFSEGDVALSSPLARGMSGGPTVDMNGAVVGVNQAADFVIGVVCGAEEINEFLRTVK